MQIDIMLRGQNVGATILNMVDNCGTLMVSYKEPGKPTYYGCLEIDIDGKRESVRSLEQFRALTKRLGNVACLRGVPAR